jgi:hypothetical protein
VGLKGLRESGGGHNWIIKRNDLGKILTCLRLTDEEATVTEEEATEEAAEASIRDNATLPPTLRESLIQARRGQGLFRANVLMKEPRCRLTGVDDPTFLRASHIKPWAVADNLERLDGNNGLMLAPHIDHLFDQGYITFLRDGTLRVAEGLQPILMAWHLPSRANVGPFSKEQEGYLAYHRAHRFRRCL